MLVQPKKKKDVATFGLTHSGIWSNFWFSMWQP